MSHGRFSPTGVGNICQENAGAGITAVQPHWCGEHYKRPVIAADNDGSAPLVWGTFLRLFAQRKLRRFSPTGVGNIIELSKKLQDLTVQPHWCGEHKNVRKTNTAFGGSAPLVWGTLALLSARVCLLRFSPTGVGNIF